MKQIVEFLFILVLVIGFSLQSHADLLVRGTDSLGNQLIYDSDLNITWYDYTNSSDDNSWQTQMNWVSGLSVTGGNLVGVYDDWRLPTTVDDIYEWGYNGTTSAGYNITSSEMGYLFYSELGNKGYYSTTGVYQSDYGLKIKSPFTNLLPSNYWSGTEYNPYDDTDPTAAWVFTTATGSQDPYNKGFYDYAIAVRDGDVTVVPEPISTMLFLTGGATLIGRKYLRRKKIEV